MRWPLLVKAAIDWCMLERRLSLTHRVDLVAAPFNLDPIEGKPRFVGRPSDAGPRVDYSVDFVRVFRVEPVGVDPRDDA